MPKLKTSRRSVIKKIIGYFNNQHTLLIPAKDIMDLRQDFLKPGKYKLVDNFFFVSVDALKFVEKNFYYIRNPLTRARLKIKHLLGSFLQVKVPYDGEKKYNGELIVFTRLGDYKIFDFEEKLVFHFVLSHENYYNLKTTYQHFAKWFEIPIKHLYDDKQLIAEQLITTKTSETLPTTAHSDILDEFAKQMSVYLAYCRVNNQHNYVNLSNLYEEVPSNLQKNKTIRQLYKLIFDKNLHNWPSVRCHGDFWSGNVLKDEQKYYIIDWEDSGEHIFFYDFLYYISFEATNRNNPLLVNEYLHGLYDMQMEKMFNAIGIKFSPRNRPLYLSICLLERIIKVSNEVDRLGSSHIISLASDILRYF